MELNVNGDAVIEPVTNSLIEQSIGSLTGEGDSFAILAKAPQVYIQTSGDASGGFILEYRDGSEEEHYSCSNFELSAGEVIRAFQSYLADDGIWKTEFEWQPQVFDYSENAGRSGGGYVVVGLIVVAIVIWKFFFAS